MSKTKLLVLVLLATAVASFFILDLGQYLNLEYFKAQRSNIETYYATHPWRSIALYFVVYVLVTASSLPGAAIMTLAGGAIFGLFVGTVVVSFASSIGATLAFLASRFLLKDWVQERFGQSLKRVNEGIRKDGAFYLFTMRLVPAIPFFVINLVMGLTPIRPLVFYLVSQVGMLAGTVVYVNAGTQIGQLDSVSGILSPGLLASFALLGVFPLLAKKVVDFVKARRVLGEYAKPKRFDRNLVVIGAGSAGLVTAYIAATVKARVTLIEKHKMGGDCLNTGCVPSKALIRSAKYLSHIRRAADFGMKTASVDWEFADIMQRVHRVIERIEPHDSVERYTRLGVDCIEGEARIISPYEVRVDGQVLTTKNIVLATGARPFVPPIPGIEEIDYWTSDNLWEMRQRPARLVVLGGGPIGCELAQCFARLGSQVTQVEMLPRLLVREDPEISQRVQNRFAEEGINVLLNHKAKSFDNNGAVKAMTCEHAGAAVRIEFDELLVAVGRKPNTEGFGLEDLGVALSSDGTIEVNEYLQTNFPNIYACGDVAGPYQFTHTAAHQAWFASVNALLAPFKRFRADYSVIPWATFTEPEVARVGLNELEAKEEGIAYEVTTYGIDDLDRAIADSEAHGMVKVLTVPGKDRILGVTIVGEHAGDLIAEFVTAMKYKLGLNKILGTIHIYPTLAEANKFAAGEWKRAHAPQTLLKWVERFHTWRLR